jgi:fumarylacetoacetate (FAA) hydrolase
MKLVSFEFEGAAQAGVIIENNIYRFSELGLPATMLPFLQEGEEAMNQLRAKVQEISENPTAFSSYPCDDVKLLAPIPNPPSCRDGYAFRQHVFTARRNRGVPMIPEFDQYPVFYFTNHQSVIGPGDVWLMPDHFQKLDFELEAAIVIGKKGRNIRAEDADQYIAGYTIMDDLSARTLQMEEMLLNLGPAKGKDFATSIGPFLVTPDELEPFKVPAPEGHVGNQYNLRMVAFVNGKQVSEGNLAQMDWTFAEIIERASYGVELQPGDVIGSGTVGTGCFLELNGSGLLNDKNYQPQWLQDGDEMVLEIEQLGRLRNTMRHVDTDYSLLKMKKQVQVNNG